MKKVLLALLLGSAICVMADSAPAYAQTTEQTDKSEEDWRKSRKKRDTTDIFEDILNKRNTGSGSGYGPPNPIESLPEESRRHLMRERAKILATSEPGKTSDTAYNPSEAAKSDSDLQEQEKEAWEEIVKDINGGGQNNGAGQANGQGDETKTANAGRAGSGQGQQGQSQQGQSASSGSRGGYKGPSPLRGGSSASVSDILAKIKGMQPRSGYGGGSSSQNGSGKAIGQKAGIGAGQIQGPLGSGGGTGNSTGSSKGQSSQSQQGQSQQGQQSSQQQSTQSNAVPDQQSDNAQSQAEAAAQAQAQEAAEAQAWIQSEIGPLDRIKKARTESNRSGRKTSASDFLRKTKD